jgi:hypothetical protein
MYLDKRYIIFKLADLRYLTNMLNFLVVLVAKYTLARGDIRSYAASTLGCTDFNEPNPLAISTCVQPYNRLFDEIKMPPFKKPMLCTGQQFLVAINLCYVLCNNKPSFSLTCRVSHFSSLTYPGKVFSSFVHNK